MIEVKLKLLLELMFLFSSLELLLIKKEFLNNEINMFVLFFRFDEGAGLFSLNKINIKILIYDYFFKE